MVQCSLINRSARGIKYQNEIPSGPVPARVPVHTPPYIIIYIAGDGYTAYFISGINYKPSNALKKEKERNTEPVDSNGVMRCIKIICTIVMGIFIPWTSQSRKRILAPRENRNNPYNDNYDVWLRVCIRVRAIYDHIIYINGDTRCCVLKGRLLGEAAIEANGRDEKFHVISPYFTTLNSGDIKIDIIAR